MAIYSPLHPKGPMGSCRLFGGLELERKLTRRGGYGKPLVRRTVGKHSPDLGHVVMAPMFARLTS